MKISFNAKVFGAFFAGLMLPIIFQVSNSMATTTSLSGSFICIGSYSTWGWPSASGNSKEYNEVSFVDFSAKTYSVIVNEASIRVGSSPNYIEGPVEAGTFSISQGPIPGTFKMNFQKEYVILAPVNSGNSIFIIDSGSGMTGTCQKI
jgi:hypothetical protein